MYKTTFGGSWEHQRVLVAIVSVFLGQQGYSHSYKVKKKFNLELIVLLQFHQIRRLLPWFFNHNFCGSIFLQQEAGQPWDQAFSQMGIQASRIFFHKFHKALAWAGRIIILDGYLRIVMANLPLILSKRGVNISCIRQRDGP